jgi:hypothetical protein
MMTECLHQLCHMAFTCGEVLADWLRGVVVPLHKDSDRRQPLNYRPITLLSIADKLYTGVVQARLIGARLTASWCLSKAASGLTAAAPSKCSHPCQRAHQDASAAGSARGP